MLIGRYNAALARERELASEVAHELRTPLASLRLHTASLQYDLSPEQLGYSVSVFALVGLNSQAETDLKAFEELVSGWNEIRECHMLAGEADFLLKIVAETWDEYQKFLTTRLTSAPNVSHVKSMMVFRTAKQLPGVPIAVE